MFFQETFDINSYFYHYYIVHLFTVDKKCFTQFRKGKLIKVSQETVKTIYLYKSVNIEFLLH